MLQNSVFACITDFARKCVEHVFSHSTGEGGRFQYILSLPTTSRSFNEFNGSPIWEKAGDELICEAL